MACTIKDVAKLAGTSIATVSFVINEKKGVKPETREKVLNAIQLLNYQPNISARNLVKQKTNTIAFIVTDIKNPFYSSLAYEMQQAATQNGYGLLLGISNNDIREEQRLVKMMIARGADGILLVACQKSSHDPQDMEHLYECKRMGIPLLFVTNKYYEIVENGVTTDYKAAMYELTAYLLKRGCRKIVFFSDGYGPYYSRTRIDGFKEAYEDAGLSYDERWIVNGKTANTVTGKAYTKDSILDMKPDAIICINATSALGVMACLKEEGISVPEEISVACFDELDYNNVLYKPLTYSRQNIKEICEQSLKRFEEIENGETEKQDILIPGELCVRETVK
ncbi:Glucose-resistance amylase regulator [uncultured Clostridium sp.]|uniref:LacI family transcriptional regulator n=1 Tax=Muricoprocola aceti TaxID=2981772 RepID=A0ABT2SQ29_9FIRM|nr:LacI family DNA-binding transcriptional regulator [Muricoprocola aceti]MCU6726153.1 LacI family transcriptional regulator [Muricoprocola aceti]SCH79525.1 Glucose-resistance amylase regulator [uncultured Clostridium sp.]